MDCKREYYEAYDDRYKQVHQRNLRWFSDTPSGIVSDVMARFAVGNDDRILELGCGEGRDAKVLLKNGFSLLATDISPQAIGFCREETPEFAEKFQVLDCVRGELDEKFDFIYAVAVVHMLVCDHDRAAFYRFIRSHLKPDGLCLICTMGDGTAEYASDIRRAFEAQERRHGPSGQLLRLPGTSCRVVSFDTLSRELSESDLVILEQGMTSVEPDFPVMMYAVAKGKS